MQQITVFDNVQYLPSLTRILILIWSLILDSLLQRVTCSKSATIEL